MQDFHVIRHLSHVEKLSARKIASKLGIDKKTVNKYLQASTPPSYQSRQAPTRSDPAEKYTKTIESLAKDPKNLAVDIYEALVDQGYQGSERTIRRRVEQLRQNIEKERFFEQKYTPGQQSQFDFKEGLKIEFVDGTRTINLLFGTLPYSNTFFISAFHLKTYECFIEGMYRFFESIGGMTHEQRIDNLAPCVAQVHKGRRRTFTKAFQAAIDHYGLNISPCRPGKGNDKGHVERSIRTHARRIERKIQGKVFTSIDELNSWLKDYSHRDRNTLLEEEKKNLLPLIERNEEVMCRTESLKIGPTGLVRAGDYVYSVPSKHIGKTCQVLRSPERIIIKVSGSRVADHDRRLGSSIALEHIIFSLIQKPGAMINWAHKKVLFPRPAFKSFYQKLKKIDSNTAEAEYLRTLNLIQHRTLDQIEQAIQTSCCYETIKKDLLGENVICVQEQSPINVDLKNYDQFL